MTRPPKKFVVSLVGAGRVGTSLALMLRRRGHRIVSVQSRSMASARRLARLTGAKVATTDPAQIHPSTDLLLLSVPDDAIRTVALDIARRSTVRWRSLTVLHTSGALSSDELRPLRRKGAQTGSFHPMQLFPPGLSTKERLKMLRGITYGIEGTPAAVRMAMRLARDAGGKPLRIPKEGKILYHLACVFASNYVIAVLGGVSSLIAPVVPGVRLRPFAALVRASVEQTLERSPAAVLTGPVARGDVATIRRHLVELRRKLPRLSGAYRELGLLALRVAKEGTLSPRLAKKIARLLKSVRN